MIIRLRSLWLAVLATSLMASSAYPQELPASAPAPAHLAHVEGAVDVVLDGVTERADPPLMLLDGDLVRTRDGRAEIIFGDGTVLHVAPHTELEALGREHLRLTTGRVIVRMSHAAARPYVVDTPASSVRLEAEGEYTLMADRDARLEVAVSRGVATVVDESQWTIRGGQRLTVASGGRPLIQMFNSARWDSFAQWAHERTNGVSISYSASQLPYELRPYSAVPDQDGRWDYMAPHGRVWIPSVDASWRPYYEGSWSYTRYGWTWYGRDRWAWPTHHYGRWDFNGAAWYWIPATAWAPAWVSWSIAPGYVSWAPSGWYGSGWRATHPAYVPNHSPWRGWTVVPRDHFAPRRSVRTHAVDAGRLDDATRRALLASGTNRRADNVAVPRDSAGVVGARGNVRRPDNGRTADPQSRRLPAAAAPGAAGTVRGAPAARERRLADDPSFAPSPSPDGAERGGAVQGAASEGAQRGATTPRDADGRGRVADRERRRPSGEQTPAPRSAPRNEPAAAAPPQSSGDTRGAVPRSGGSRRGEGTAVTPPAATQPDAAPPGGARRRPGV